MSEPYTNLLDYGHDLGEALKNVDSLWVEEATLHLRREIRLGKRIFVCGNGGSAAIAEHLTCDCTKGIHGDTGLTPRVYSLVSNVSLLTAIANDLEYDEVFSHQLKMFAQVGDTLIIISSSGNSKNVEHALVEALAIGMWSVGITGFDEKNTVNSNVNFPIHIPSDNYGIVEDASQAIMHYIAQSIRRQERKENLEENEIKY